MQVIPTQELITKLLTQLQEALNRNLIRAMEVVNPKHDLQQSYVLVTFNPETPHETQIALLSHIEARYDLPVGLSTNKDCYTELITESPEIRYMTIQTPRIK